MSRFILTNMRKLRRRGPGRSIIVVTEVNVKKVEIKLLADRRVKLWEIVAELQISKEGIGEILHQHLNMKEKDSIWIHELHGYFRGENLDAICDRIVIVDETWIRQYDPESIQ